MTEATRAAGAMLIPATSSAAAAIGLLDLRVIAPLFFPEVAALAFWPQMADHLMWGACVGVVLQVRWKRDAQP